jgi:endogenous inhibitor of DNA gyrase (YacG/DUF329 family)
MTSSAATCPTCGQPIEVTARNPNKRFCSSRCRVADWHRRHDRPGQPPEGVEPVVDHVLKGGTPLNIGNDVSGGANHVPGGVNVANGEQRCPHCRKPIAVIAILVPPAAAHVRTPEVTMTDG